MQKYKKDSPFSYALGTELTLELLQNYPDKVRTVYVSSRQKENEIYGRIMELCRHYRIEVVKGDRAFNVVNAKENCYIMGVFDKFDRKIDPGSNHVVLVNPSNMGNLGTIIRSMLAFGLEDLAIIAPAADIWDPKVIRASMRAFFSLRFEYFDSFEAYLSSVNRREVYPFMLDGRVSLDEVKPAERWSLVFGNEATGLEKKFHEYGTSVRIRQSDKVDSLNLDNAVSIGIYEFTR